MKKLIACVLLLSILCMGATFYAAGPVDEDIEGKVVL